MAEYTWRQWEAEQNDSNLLHASDCERWQAGIELAGGTWDGSWTDLDTSGKGLITIDQFNSLESQIQSKVSSYTPKGYDPDSTVQIVPGPDGWNKVEDGILQAICTPDGVNRNLLGNSSANLGSLSSWQGSGPTAEVADGYDGQNAVHIIMQNKTATSRYFYGSNETSNVLVANTNGMTTEDPISISLWCYVSDTVPVTSLSSRTEFVLRQYPEGEGSQSDRQIGVIVNASGGLEINYNEWTKLEITTTLPFNQSGQRIRVALAIAGDIDILISRVKIEKGKEITEWSPAPEDYGYPDATALTAAPQSVEDSDEVAAPEAEEIE